MYLFDNIFLSKYKFIEKWLKICVKLHELDTEGVKFSKKPLETQAARKKLYLFLHLKET